MTSIRCVAPSNGCKSIRGVDRVLFAMKANSNPAVLRTVHDAGLGFECVSPGEIRRVLELFPDIDRDRILFTPNFAPRSEYRIRHRAESLADPRQPVPAAGVGRDVPGARHLPAPGYRPRARAPPARAHGGRAFQVRHPLVRARRGAGPRGPLRTPASWASMPTLAAAS